MIALVLNAGSSSLKYQMVDTESRDSIYKGQIERIGIDGLTHDTAVTHMLAELEGAHIDLTTISVVGHRVVHGGNVFKGATKIDAKVLAEIEKLIPLAPLHNPAHVIVMKEMMKQLADVAHVAVFDTSFHATMPEEAYTYAIDRAVAEKFEIRRYGFHGSSHKYVAEESARFLGKTLNETSLIVCHIGNGASIAAIRDGVCIDTSMGMTPLEGLVMGTRSGDIDAGVLFHLSREGNYSVAQLDELLNKKSGLLGLTGSADMREVHDRADAGDEQAILARKIYAYRIQKYIGSYMTQLPKLDAIVFTAGVGENDAALRQSVLESLDHLGISLDVQLNLSPSRETRVISTTQSRIKALVIPTNEELEIALESVHVIGG
jgi:acetate kinase